MRAVAVTILLLLVAGSATGLAWLSSQPTQAVRTLSPTDDSYVTRDVGSLASPLESRITGLSQELVTGYTFTSTNHTLTYIYLRFDLTGLRGRSITNATLGLYASDLSFTAQIRHIDVRYVNNSNWSERTLNYLNAPPFEPALVSQAVLSHKGTWYSWDLTNLISQLAPKPTSVVISMDAVQINKTEFVSFSSNDSPTNQPQLVVHFVAPPSGILDIATTYPGAIFTVLGLASAGAIAYLAFRGRTARPPQRVCPSCGRPVRRRFKVCPYCGEELRW